MTMDKNKPLLSQPNWLLWIPLLISAVVLGAYVWNFVQQPLSDNADQWGTFVDDFGGLLNPVIATCTLFVALRVWELQKTELKATQKALQEQAKTAEQHPTFARLLRAQLSHAELTLIGLCLLFHDDAKRSIPAFEKYGILKHLPDSRLRDEIAAKHPRSIDGRISMNQDVHEQENQC